MWGFDRAADEQVVGRDEVDAAPAHTHAVQQCGVDQHCVGVGPHGSVVVGPVEFGELEDVCVLPLPR